MRSIFTMMVSLYTSRITLKALGVDDFGVYNVVGGFVAMVGIVTSPISSAISRYLMFGLGKGEPVKLNQIFITSVNTLYALGGIVLILGETLGIWFLNHKLNIPSESMYAANWVLQCSILTTIISLSNTPYISAIIAHEKMQIFAYMSIIEVVFKLVLVIFLLNFHNNTLIIYSLAILAISISMRILYGIYTHRAFEECRYKFQFNGSIFKEMTGFAWWTFLGNTASVFNSQGVAMLMNIFFGVVLNTAKGIAGQVETAVVTFVNNFTTSFTPQITKSYASGDASYMHSIMCRGSKFSIYLFLYFLIPLEFEAYSVLKVWLGEVPEYSVDFLKLSLLCNAVLMLGSPFYQGIMATGKIRNYQIAITIIGCMVFPLTWLAYKLGAQPQMFYIIYFVIYNILVWVRMWFVKRLLNFSMRRFIYEVIIPIVIITLLASIPAYAINHIMRPSFIRICTTTVICSITTTIIILSFGLTKNEKKFILSQLHLNKKSV